MFVRRVTNIFQEPVAIFQFPFTARLLHTRGNTGQNLDSIQNGQLTATSVQNLFWAMTSYWIEILT